jgi:Lrp/AsnC family transcriptional regulator for asnA, asnC and gidA
MQSLDEIDRKILHTLLKDARSKIKDIARNCGVSATTITNRIQQLKGSGVIVKEELMIDPAYFGYKYPITIGINLTPNEEKSLFEVIKEKIKLVGIDYFIGAYDLAIFAFVKTLDDVQQIKHLIQKQKGVNEVDIMVWNKTHFHFENFILKNFRD